MIINTHFRVNHLTFKVDNNCNRVLLTYSQMTLDLEAAVSTHVFSSSSNKTYCELFTVVKLNLSTLWIASRWIVLLTWWKHPMKKWQFTRDPLTGWCNETFTMKKVCPIRAECYECYEFAHNVQSIPWQRNRRKYDEKFPYIVYVDVDLCFSRWLMKQRISSRRNKTALLFDIQQV